MACTLCPGYFSVWYPYSDSVWQELENVDSWNLEANVQEATKKRTSSTKGIAVKFCADTVDYTASVTTTLCQDKWLLCDILGGNKRSMSKPLTDTWFFLGWAGDANGNPVGPSLDLVDLNTYRQGFWTSDMRNNQDPGIYIFGSIVPPGFGGDNTNTDPTTATFSINVAAGPVLPRCNGRDIDTGPEGEGEFPEDETNYPSPPEPEV